MSTLNVDKVDPSTGTALELGTSGDTVSLPSGATLDISASTLTPPATMPASSGINFTALNATNLGSGTVPTARLGTGTASSSTVLYGDQTYKTEPGGGKILQVVTASGGGGLTTSSTFASTGLFATITPTDDNNAIFVMASSPRSYNNGTEYLYFSIYNGTSGEGSGAEIQQGLSYGPGWSGGTRMTQVMNVWHLPASTDAETYTVMHRNSNDSTATGWFENGYGTSNSTIVLMEIDI
jgi:hypothetical protein